MRFPNILDREFLWLSRISQKWTRPIKSLHRFK